MSTTLPSSDTENQQSPLVKKPAKASSMSIRPLTLAERKKPAQLMFCGGFKNTSFQLGEILLPPTAEPRNENPAPSVRVVKLQKSASIAFPVHLPLTITPLKGVSNVICSVQGRKNSYGGYDAHLVVRGVERLSTFNTKLRNVTHLVETSQDQDANEKDESERLGISSNARSHNQVMLAGVVVGAYFEDGESQRFHIQLRQDANPENIIPLVYEARNASALVSRVKFGSYIYVDGEFAYRNVPIYKLDDDGKISRDPEGKPTPVVDEAGQAVKRKAGYIRIQAPKDPAEFDVDFKTPPKWVQEIAEKIQKSKQRIIAQTDATESVAASDGPAAAGVADNY